MNKIYKVIWSKVKNCYVVASELAKNHTKSPKSSIVGSVELENKIAHSLMNSAVCVPIISTDFIAPVAMNLAASIGKKISQAKQKERFIKLIKAGEVIEEAGLLDNYNAEDLYTLLVLNRERLTKGNDGGE